MGSPDGPTGKAPAQFTEQEPGEGERDPCLCVFSQPQGKSNDGGRERGLFFFFFFPPSCPCSYSEAQLL